MKVRVKTYHNSTTRSYFPETGRLCEQDGFLFREKKASDEDYGVIRFEEAERQTVQVLKKIGHIGLRIIQVIGQSPLRKHFIEGRLTSSSQLDIQFKGVPIVKVDKLIVEALEQALTVDVTLVNEKDSPLAKLTR